MSFWNDWKIVRTSDWINIEEYKNSNILLLEKNIKLNNQLADSKITIEDLQKQLDKLTPKENKMEDYFHNKYPVIDECYAGRTLPNSNVLIKVDVRTFLNINDSEVKKIITSLNLKADNTDDENVLVCLNWIIDNFRYVGDAISTGRNEFWKFPFESLASMNGDCEDGALLLYNLCLAAGINYWKLRVTAGLVKEPNTNNFVGHCYLTYYCEQTDDWKIMDWCYYPNTLEVNKRKNYKDETNYSVVWFSFNSKYAYATDTKNLKYFNGGTKIGKQKFRK